MQSYRIYANEEVDGRKLSSTEPTAAAPTSSRTTATSAPSADNPPVINTPYVTADTSQATRALVASRLRPAATAANRTRAAARQTIPTHPNSCHSHAPGSSRHDPSESQLSSHWRPKPIESGEERAESARGDRDEREQDRYEPASHDASIARRRTESDRGRRLTRGCLFGFLRRPAAGSFVLVLDGGDIGPRPDAPELRDGAVPAGQ